MRILVTGGTGYVGSHAVAALARAGHSVRLLVRAPERIAPALDPLGVTDVEHAVGDVTDERSVEQALDGCDAVVHGASVYSLNRRDWETMARINVPGTQIVLDAAVRRGLDPVIHVSSTAAFLPGGQRPTTADSPPGEPTAPYSRTKADSERIARAHQDRGAPVVSVSPGAVFGPHDPHLGEMHLLVLDLLHRRIPVFPRGSMHAVDVREVATTIVALIEQGRGPRRYIVPGYRRDIPTIARELSALTGKRIPALAVPAGAVLAAGSAADRIQRLLPFRLPASREAIYVMSCDMRVDAAAAERDLAISPRPFSETLGDSVRWLVQAGQLDARHASKLTATPAAA